MDSRREAVAFREGVDFDDSIRDRLRLTDDAAGRGMMGTPSIKEVARQAGVSVGTVSNFLNRPSIVAPATRKRVQ